MTETAEFSFSSREMEFASEDMVRFIESEQGKNKAERTVEKYARGLEDFSTWLAENERDVTDVDFLDIQNYLSYLTNDQKYADKTVYGKFVPVRLFYNQLKKLDRVDDNPVEEVDITDYIDSTRSTRTEEKTNKSRIYLSKEELMELVDNVPAPRLRNRLCILFLYYTGLRVSEVTHIKLDNLNREQRTVEVEIKGGDSHTAIWHEKLDGLLTQWLDYGYRESYPTAEDSEYLFVTNTTERLSASRLNEIINEAANNAGLQEVIYEDTLGRKRKKISAHTLRHSFAMHFLQEGGSFEALSNRLAHSSVTTTEIYGEVEDDRGMEEYEEVMEPLGIEEEIEYEQCLLCGQQGNLQTHHMTYQPPRTIPVCNSCQQDIHNKDEYQHLQPDKSRSWAEEHDII